MKHEQALLKMTLLLIRDWDGFQIAIREIMKHSNRRNNG
jgi:hypothetical protein